MHSEKQLNLRKSAGKFSPQIAQIDAEIDLN